ncbi:hypothetical protein X781_14420 [Mannheimia sp. USDA-ARS-USMARC-1261]|nr:hypothetical protein X781_14420 [Mannheimia sp. USDA-ARS-USMARC-1261]
MHYWLYIRYFACSKFRCLAFIQQHTCKFFTKFHRLPFKKALFCGIITAIF